MATDRQIRYCVKRAEQIFWNDRERLRDGKVLGGYWGPAYSNGYIVKTERFDMYRTTAAWTSLIKYKGKIKLETEILHYDGDKVDYSAAYHAELDAKEAETAEQMFKYE